MLPKRANALKLKYNLGLVLESFKRSVGEDLSTVVISYETTQNKQAHLHIYIGLNERNYYSQFSDFYLTLETEGNPLVIKPSHVRKVQRNFAALIDYILKDKITLSWGEPVPKDKEKKITIPFLNGEMARIHKEFEKTRSESLTKPVGTEMLPLKKAWLKLLTETYPNPGLTLLSQAVTNWNILNKEYQSNLEVENDSFTQKFALTQFRFSPVMLNYCLSVLFRSKITLILHGKTMNNKTNLMLIIGALIFKVDSNSCLFISSYTGLSQLRADHVFVILDDVALNNDVKDNTTLLHLFDKEENREVRVLWGDKPIPRKLNRVFTTNSYHDLIRSHKWKIGQRFTVSFIAKR